MTTLTDNINITEELGRIKTTIKRIIEDYDSLRQECMDRHIEHLNDIKELEDMTLHNMKELKKLEDSINRTRRYAVRHHKRTRRQINKKYT